MDNINFKKITLTELERKDLILSLVCVNDCFQFSQINTNTISIKAPDRPDITINFDDKKSNSFHTLKDIIEYVYDYRHYTREDIIDDEDALNHIFKFANAMILDISNEGKEAISTHIHPTTTQLSIFRRIVALEKISCNTFGKSQNMYSATLIARYIAESIQQAQLFVHSLDLLDYIHIIDTFSSIVPSHNDGWVDFATQMLSMSDETA